MHIDHCKIFEVTTNMTKNKQVSAIVAMAENRVIGNQNQLPWHLSADLKHFKEITTGHTVIMGRKTYESIGKPLPNRQNVIMTRDMAYQAQGCVVVNTLAQALARDGQLFVIGGAEIYKLAWPKLTKLYLTLVHHAVKGDARFPEFDLKQWHAVSQEDHKADDKNQYDYSFLVLEKP